MPESRIRRKKAYTPPAEGATAPKKPVKIGSPRWLVPTMLALFIVGLIYIVAYYIAAGGSTMPPPFSWVFNGNPLANVGLGFLLIGAGFGLSTRWR